ncbi:hypothetical protein EJ04DRAFT_561174 [Polyplosphaeria fusca]|uniref:Uncharacterized protein n=1 Tax=Polyplosphaeria fusca TaxID=682080 RepID=A0A9P4V4R8_9PLEO|nr:hypothetical protein EJ04DRAFT_561174 [Polyplosphaeria fusca]
MAMMGHLEKKQIPAKKKAPPKKEDTKPKTRKRQASPRRNPPRTQSAKRPRTQVNEGSTAGNRERTNVQEQVDFTNRNDENDCASQSSLPSPSWTLDVETNANSTSAMPSTTSCSTKPDNLLVKIASLEVDMQNLKHKHIIDLEKARRQSEESEMKHRQLQEDQAKKHVERQQEAIKQEIQQRLDMRLELEDLHVKLDNEIRKCQKVNDNREALRVERNDAKERLEAEVKHSKAIRMEKDGLQAQLRDASQEILRLQELVSQKEKLNLSLKEHERSKADLSNSLKELSTQCEDEKQGHNRTQELLKAANIKSDEAEALRILNEELTEANSALKKDLEAAKRSSPSLSLSDIAPEIEGLSVLVGENARTDNVRKTFAKVRRQLDSLYSICRKLSESTKGMGLEHFGEFGNLLRRLKIAVEEVDTARRTREE